MSVNLYFSIYTKNKRLILLVIPLRIFGYRYYFHSKIHEFVPFLYFFIYKRHFQSRIPIDNHDRDGKYRPNSEWYAPLNTVRL